MAKLIKYLFASDISRRIEEVIKVDQTDDQIIYEEISEYVATDSIRDYYSEILERYRETPNKSHEGAELFGVGKTFVDKLLGIHRAEQDLAPRPHGGGCPARLLPRHEKLLRSRVRQRKGRNARRTARPPGRAIRAFGQRLDRLALAHPPRPGA